jgi:hypothetical protein
MKWRMLGALAGALAVVGVAVALLAPSNGTILDPVAQAANTTAAARTAEFGIAGSVTAAGQTIPINGNGAIDMRNQRLRMSMSFPIPGFGSMTTDALMDGKAIYMHMPEALASRIPLGKSWMKIDLAALAKSNGVDLGGLSQPSQSNPADMLQALKAVGSSRKVGSEDLNGVPTTHYRATIDPKKALDRIPDKQSAGALKQMLSTSGLTSIPIDVWIDRAGRVRRESMKFSANGTSMDMTISFTRFGVAVDTTPPPSDQVLDAGSLLALAGRVSG